MQNPVRVIRKTLSNNRIVMDFLRHREKPYDLASISRFLCNLPNDGFLHRLIRMLSPSRKGIINNATLRFALIQKYSIILKDHSFCRASDSHHITRIFLKFEIQKRKPVYHRRIFASCLFK